WPYGVGLAWSPVTQAWFFFVDLLWVAAMLATFWRDPQGRMWKLFLALQIVGALGVLWVFPTSLTWPISQILIGFGSVVFVHLVLAFPSGRLTDRYDRLLVGGAYLFVAISRLAWVVVWNPPFHKDAFTPHNPFLLFPSDAFAFLFGPAAILVITPFLF